MLTTLLKRLSTLQTVSITSTSRTKCLKSRGADTFLGACIDSAAQKTFIGRKQAKAYCDFAKVDFELRTDGPRRSFSFATHERASIGTILIRVPITESHFIELLADVVNIHVPFLLGLDTMKQLKLVLDTDKLQLSSKSEGWEVPLTSKRGHLLYDWKSEIIFTQAEFVRIHRHCYHHNSGRLYSMRKRGIPGKRPLEVPRDLERVERTCDLC